MLQALIRDLSEIADVELMLMLDVRFTQLIELYRNIGEVVVVDAHDSTVDIFERLSRHCDAVWPVAPEIDDILLELTKIVESSRARLLSVSSEVVVLTSNKLETYRLLMQQGITTVSTALLDRHAFIAEGGRFVVKPIDGMGCEQTFLIENAEHWAIVNPELEPNRTYIVQPYVEGTPASLSALFDAGRGWLLCRNVQKIEVDNGRFFLKGCHVNDSLKSNVYEILVQRIAQALPSFSGYAGIDIIETDTGPSVLEINPRLTTSYAGIHRALGINVAEIVLQLPIKAPCFNTTLKQSIVITLDGDDSYAS